MTYKEIYDLIKRIILSIYFLGLYLYIVKIKESKKMSFDKLLHNIEDKLKDRDNLDI